MQVLELISAAGVVPRPSDIQVLVETSTGLHRVSVVYFATSAVTDRERFVIQADVNDVEEAAAETEVTSDPNSVVIGGGYTTRFRALVEVLRQVRNKYNVKVAGLVIKHVGLADNLNKIDPQKQQTVIDVCRGLLYGRTPAGQNEPDAAELKLANEHRQAMIAMIDEHKNALLDPMKMMHWTLLRVTLAKMDDADWLRASLAAVEILGR